MSDSDERIIIITGGNSGIGYYAAVELAKVPSNRVVIASRNLERVQKAVAAIQKETGNSKVEGEVLDLSSLDSVKAFAARFASTHQKLHALVANAGLQNRSFRLSADGIEETFAVNHLGHYLLIRLLLPLLEQTGTASDPSRIVVVSSDTHDPEAKTGLPAPSFTSTSELTFQDNADRTSWSTFRSYTNSKLCNVLFTYELHRKLQASGSDSRVAIFCYNPGFIPETGLKNTQPFFVQFILTWLVGPLLRIIRPKAMSTQARSGAFLAALSSDAQFLPNTGKYYSITKLIPSSKDSYNEAKSSELWKSSEKLVQTWLN